MRLTAIEFRDLLERVAVGWRNGDAELAASCFTDDAVYLEPPDRQRYQDRAALRAFFGGDSPRPMDMDWHHVLFDEKGQFGAGEYTFHGSRRFHGIVLIHLVGGLIGYWREYQYESALAWGEFVNESEP